MSDGKRILIKWGALPGSIVDLRIVKQRKDYVEAHIAKIIELDPKIVDGEIFCPHFFSITETKNDDQSIRKIGCWGCKWQMLSYANQLKLKEDIVNDAFTKLKKKLPELHILSIIGSPQEKFYRNKIEFSFGKYISKNSEWVNEVLSNRSCGFHKQGEFSKIVDIDNCSLISDEANILYNHIKELCRSSGLPAYDQMTHQGFFRHLVIREGTNTDQFLVNLAVADNNLKTKNDKQRNRFLDTLKADDVLKKKVTTFVITYNNGVADVIRSQECETKTFWGEGYIHEVLQFKNTHNKNEESQVSPESKTEELSLTEVTFRVSPFSFFQTNTLWAQQLFSQAMSMTGYVEWTILDLYCGTGSIGISFLKTGKGNKLVGIEIVEDAITDAWHNAKINGIDEKVIFLATPAEKAFLHNPEIKKKLDNLGLVIIDPPRDGLHPNVVKMICELKKESDFKLLYISCNPVTMVRDIELLVQWGFTIREIQPVDMFPQTHHIECIWVLH
jgi:23S rRNA (uracil1939-C5)-methyltransferase